MINDRNIDSEKALCRTMFIVSLRDVISTSKSSYSKKCRKKAIKWLNSTYEDPFSFENLITYLFGEEIDAEVLRKRLKKMLMNKNHKGSKNLINIFKEYT
jgi:hypothetical protein